MKKITLVKTTPEIQLGHIYEHLFIIELIKLSKNHKLINFLDCSWSGTTSEKGYVFVSISLISEEAVRLEAEILDLKVNTDQLSVTSVIAQINAEEEYRIGGNEELVYDALKALQETPWQTPEKFDIEKAEKIRRSRKVMWDSDTKSECEEMIITTEIETPHTQEALIIARTLLDNIGELFMLKNYYRVIESTQSRESGLSCTDKYRVWTINDSFNIDEERRLVVKTLKQLQENDAAQKVAQHISRFRIDDSEDYTIRRGPRRTPDLDLVDQLLKLITIKVKVGKITRKIKWPS